MQGEVDRVYHHENEKSRYIQYYIIDRFSIINVSKKGRETLTNKLQTSCKQGLQMTIKISPISLEASAERRNGRNKCNQYRCSRSHFWTMVHGDHGRAHGDHHHHHHHQQHHLANQDHHQTSIIHIHPWLNQRMDQSSIHQ